MRKHIFNAYDLEHLLQRCPGMLTTGEIQVLVERAIHRAGPGLTTKVCEMLVYLRDGGRIEGLELNGPSGAIWWIPKSPKRAAASRKHHTQAAKWN